MDGNKVVISGMSGTFPKSNNTKEFSEVLYNKMNPVSPMVGLTSYKHPDLPFYKGNVQDIEKFDAQFFKVNYRIGEVLDPSLRKLLEHSYQALFDAGVSIESVNNKNVGVFVGASVTEFEKSFFFSSKSITGLNLLGGSRCMFANRISYWLNTKGPSFSIDAASGSSMTALEQAWKAIVDGHCESAIVAGSFLVLHPQTIIVNGRLIKMTMSETTRSFDQNADGCVISDAINVCYLQKAKHALRVYAEIEHVKISFSSLHDENSHKNIVKNKITKFLESFYEEIPISPDSVEFVEAFGIAEPSWDKAELEAIDNCFCKNRKQPLAIGSVTSNIGYTEAASTVTALAKEYETCFKE